MLQHFVPPPGTFRDHSVIAIMAEALAVISLGSSIVQLIDFGTVGTNYQDKCCNALGRGSPRNPDAECISHCIRNYISHSGPRIAIRTTYAVGRKHGIWNPMGQRTLHEAGHSPRDPETGDMELRDVTKR